MVKYTAIWRVQWSIVLLRSDNINISFAMSRSTDDLVNVTCRPNLNFSMGKDEV